MHEMTLRTQRTITEERVTQMIGYISAELAGRSGAWEGRAPDWLPEPPEWIELMREAYRATAPRGLPHEYLQAVLESKDLELAARHAGWTGRTIGWAICDGALVIHDMDDPPEWFRFERNEDGNSIDPMHVEGGMRDSITVP